MATKINMTVEEAKQYLRDNWEKSTTCPCCQQTVKLYKFNLYWEMVYWLILLTKEYLKTNEWINHKKLNLTVKMINGNYAKLIHWGLIEKYDIHSIDKKSSGYFKPTNKGVDFVNNKILVPRRAYLYNQKCYGFSEDKISVVEALAKKFDYYELMNN